jgi:hypothetical protein
MNPPQMGMTFVVGVFVAGYIATKSIGMGLLFLVIVLCTPVGGDWP